MASKPHIDCLRLPDDAGKALRQHLRLAPSDALRISYITGPGDVVGTYAQWKNGQTDSRVPIISYSTMFYELVHQLEGQGQLLCTVDPPAQASDPFHFVKLPGLDFGGPTAYRMSERRRIRAVLDAVKTFQPHLIVAASDLSPAAWPALAKRAVLVPSLHNTFWPMGLPWTGVKGKLKYALLQRRARSVNAAVCISNECARQISELTSSRVSGRVVCPQIQETYSEAPRQSMKRLLFLGRLEENKGIFLLLEAFAALMQRHPDISLSFAGAGAAEEKLRARVDALGTSRVRILGRLSSEGVHQALSETDLIVCPTMTSFNEGLAVVGFEAAAHGIPSVLSSIVPAKDVLAPCASVFAADDAAALEACLAQLIESDTLYSERVKGTERVRDMVYDRSKSWGSQLYLALSDAAQGG